MTTTRTLRATGLLAALFVVLAGCAHHAPREHVRTDSPGTGIPAGLIDRVDEVVRSEMSRNRITGLAVGLVTDRGLVWGAGYGVTDRQTRAPVTVDTRFPVASITKPLTATALLVLEQDGEVALDDPVSAHLPGFSPPLSGPVSAGAGDRAVSRDDITIRHLLSHHAGLVRDLQRGIVGPMSDEVELVTELSSLLLADAPGTGYRYSNVGYALLGEVIEAASGSTYPEFMRRRVFEPLGMMRTSVGVGPADRAAQGFAPGHRNVGLVVPRTREVVPQARRDVAAGSVVSTVRDLAAFAGMLLAEGETGTRSLLDAGRVASMFDPPFPLQPLDEDDYALGFKIGKLISDPADARHGGTLDGYSTLIVLVPEAKVGVVVLTNTDQPFARHYIANEVVREWLDLDVEPAPRHEATSARAGAQSGHYVGVGDFSLHLEIDLESDRIVLSGEPLALVGERDPDAQRYRIVKRILGFGVPVAEAFGADEAHLDFVAVESAVLPRITLRYRNLPLEMYFRPVPDAARVAPELAGTITGRYELSAESASFARRGLSSVDIYRSDGLLFADLEGADIARMVVREVPGTALAGEVFQAVGTGETFRFDGGTLFFSGLAYGRRP